MARGNFYPRSQDYVDARKQMSERQVKWVRWEDIDDYIPTFHDFEVGDTLIALQDFEMSWGWELAKGETCLMSTNTILLLLDFNGITDYLAKVIGEY